MKSFDEEMNNGMGNEERNSKKRGRPQRYVLWKDWETWKLKEWNPLAHNDLPHIKTDVSWLKRITISILIAIVGLALAVILRGL